MADIEANVKSNVGAVGQEAKDAAGDFQIMGTSVGAVGAKIKSMAAIAKASFLTIGGAIKATGVGALLLAITALTSYFKNTQRGAEMLEKGMAGLGAAMDVVTDLFSSAGETIVGAFKDPKQAVKDLWEALKKNLLNRIEGMIDGFKGLGKVIKSALNFDWDGVNEGAKEFNSSLVQVATGMDEVQRKNFADGIKKIAKEINEESAAAMRLKGIMHDIRREEMEFSKVQAQTRQDVAKARLLAMDETKTQEERLEAINSVMEDELKMTANIIEMQKKKIAAKKEENSLGESMIEDVEALTALEVELIDLTTKSTMTQKRLMLEVETLTNEMNADAKTKEKARLKSKKQDTIALEKFKLTRLKDETDEELKIRMDAAKKEIDLAKKTAKEKETIAKAESKMKVAITKQAFGLLGNLAGENVEAGKAVAVAETIFNTQQGIMAAMGATSVADKLLPFPLRLANAIGVGLMGANAVKTILSTSPSGGGGGGGVSAAATPQTPAPQMMSGSFDLSGGIKPEPVKAFVVTDEMSNSQNQLANIRRRATI
tara:strand:- start:451 stop:2082 length:1632 start_codon:yes stop_codon:yes gene_type:complete